MVSSPNLRSFLEKKIKLTANSASSTPNTCNVFHDAPEESDNQISYDQAEMKQN